MQLTVLSVCFRYMFGISATRCIQDESSRHAILFRKYCYLRLALQNYLLMFPVYPKVFQPKFPVIQIDVGYANLTGVMVLQLLHMSLDFPVPCVRMLIWVLLYCLPFCNMLCLQFLRAAAAAVRSNAQAACPAPSFRARHHASELVGRHGRTNRVLPVIRVVADGVIGSAVHVDKAMGLPTYLLFTTAHVDSWATSTWISFFKRGCLPFRGKWCSSILLLFDLACSFYK